MSDQISTSTEKHWRAHPAERPSAHAPGRTDRVPATPAKLSIIRYFQIASSEDSRLSGLCHALSRWARRSLRIQPWEYQRCCASIREHLLKDAPAESPWDDGLHGNGASPGAQAGVW